VSVIKQGEESDPAFIDLLSFLLMRVGWKRKPGTTPCLLAIYSHQWLKTTTGCPFAFLDNPRLYPQQLRIQIKASQPAEIIPQGEG
jgi:hypothetical protein